MVQNYKLLCVDLDGTLLTDSKEISQETLEAIRAAKAKDVKVAIATGRALFSALSVGSSFNNDDDHIIASNGAIIKHLALEPLVRENPFSYDQLVCIIDTASEQGLSPVFFSTEQAYTTSTSDFQMYLGFGSGTNNVFNKQSISLIPSTKDLKELIRQEHIKIQKCNIHTLGDGQKRFLHNALKREGEFEMLFSTNPALEITAKGVTKGNGVAVLAEALGIRQQEVIAVGDSENDISMLSYAGLGIAMENAIPAVKNVASYITESNNNNGIARVIRKFIL
jgi:hypothetical protein